MSKEREKIRFRNSWPKKTQKNVFIIKASAYNFCKISITKWNCKNKCLPNTPLICQINSCVGLDKKLKQTDALLKHYNATRFGEIKLPMVHLQYSLCKFNCKLEWLYLEIYRLMWRFLLAWVKRRLTESTELAPEMLPLSSKNLQEKQTDILEMCRCTIYRFKVFN